MPHYVVHTPDYTTYPHLSDYEQIEPPEVVQDVAFVANAKNAGDAKWAAAELWEKHSRRSWVGDNRASGFHPLSGVTVERSEIVEDARSWFPFWIDLAERNES